MKNKKTGNNGETGGKKSEEKLAMCMGIGMCFGLPLGTLIGVLTKNIGLWLPMGLCFGMMFGIIVGSLLKGEQ